MLTNYNHKTEIALLILFILLIIFLFIILLVFLSERKNNTTLENFLSVDWWKGKIIPESNYKYGKYRKTFKSEEFNYVPNLLFRKSQEPFFYYGSRSYVGLSIIIAIGLIALVSFIVYKMYTYFQNNNNVSYNYIPKNMIDKVCSASSGSVEDYL